MSSRRLYSLCLTALLCGTLLVSSSYADDAVASSQPTEAEKDVQAALSELGPSDKPLAEAQRWCAVMPANRLGSMGKPVKLLLEGKPVFLCCAECEKQARANAKTTLTKVEKLKKSTAAVAKLPAADRMVAESQRFCAVRLKSELGSMGTPVKVVLEGEPVFLCCAGCKKAAIANPKATLATVKQQKAKGDHDHAHHN